MPTASYDHNLIDLIKLLKKTNMSQQGIDIVVKAYKYALIKHKGQLRESGEPYFIHPYKVARILIEKMHYRNPNVIAASLLHDTVEDCDGVSIELLTEIFNSMVAKVVDGVTKIDKRKFKSLEEADGTNLRKLLIQSIMTSDGLDNILVKLADRYHNMSTLKYKKAEYKRLEFANETFIFINIAHLLGIEWARRDLKDLAYQYLHPKYITFKQQVKKHLNQEVDNIASMKQQIAHLLEKLYKEGTLDHRYKIDFNVKCVADLYDNCISGKPLNQIDDAKQIRIIGRDREDCYRIFNIINEQFGNISSNQRYFRSPKYNLYQALHTTIKDSSGSIFQIQIMTEEMHQINEDGITYFNDNTNRMQEGFNKNAENFRKNFSKGMINILKMDNYNIDIKREKYEHSIAVTNNKGEISFFPTGSTIIDYAYERFIDDRANQVVMAYVNNKPVSIYTLLGNYDTIQLVFSSNSEGPEKEWLAHCVTPKARRGIFKALPSKEKSLTKVA